MTRVGAFDFSPYGHIDIVLLSESCLGGAFCVGHIKLRLGSADGMAIRDRGVELHSHVRQCSGREPGVARPQLQKRHGSHVTRSCDHEKVKLKAPTLFTTKQSLKFTPAKCCSCAAYAMEFTAPRNAHCAPERCACTMWLLYIRVVKHGFYYYFYGFFPATVVES